MGTVAPTGTLTVSPPSGTRQTFTLVNGNDTEAETLDFRSDGVYLVSLFIQEKQPPYPTFAETLTPVGGAVRVIATGNAKRTVSFRVASADGKTSATVTFQVVGSATAQVGGASLPALHIAFSSHDLAGSVSVFKFTGGQFGVDALISPTTALPYRQQTSTAVTVSGVSVSSTTVATLQSTTPG